MELKEFVSQTLVEIVEGIADAQTRLEAEGAEVNPSVTGDISGALRSGRALETYGGRLAQVVEFDVAVTGTEGSGTKGGIGIVTGPFNLGSAGESKSENATISRIKFNVPLSLPRKG